MGGGYNSTSGIFIAPVGGVYVCDWTILTKANVYFHSELVVNGLRMAANNLHASNLKHRQATTMTIVKLDAGDLVWIQPYQGYKGTYAYGSEWSKFSCFKL
ncbi:hypothetical protein FSP39_020799 [Pinctada imbricata]|uniref:C1q domain-containing protein n=2 Tax=Pinctada TaxID=50425 RepID=A0AA88XGV7_PINIB|nr:hypothetical protein FSP39_020799 [Pinctada imbricata]